MPFSTSGANLAHNNAAQQAGRSMGYAGGGAKVGGDTSVGGAGGGNMAAFGPTGPRGPLGPGGAPAHTNLTGPAGIATGQSSPSVGGGVGSNFQGAVADYNSPTGIGGMLNRMTQVKPNLDQPASYANGLSHTGLNIPGTLLGMGAGMFAPGAGLAVGPLASMAFRAMGIPDTVLGSAKPGIPGQETHDFSAGGNMAAGTHAAPQGGGYGSHGGNPMLGVGGVATLPQSPMSAFGAPMPQRDPGIGRPPVDPQGLYSGIPNHSLPQGYNSLFPNSLTAQDKALLYGQALAGAR